MILKIRALNFINGLALIMVMDDNVSLQIEYLKGCNIGDKVIMIYSESSYYNQIGEIVDIEFVKDFDGKYTLPYVWIKFDNDVYKTSCRCIYKKL